MKLKYVAFLLPLTIVFGQVVFAQDIKVEILKGPDSVLLNTSHNIKVGVINKSGKNLSGGVYLYYRTGLDSSGQYLGGLFETISSSQTKYLLASINISPNAFKTGDNIVVVWPTYEGGKVGVPDSLHVYVYEYNDVRNELPVAGLLSSSVNIYPNPVYDRLLISVNDPFVDIECVRIIDIVGKEKCVFTNIQASVPVDMFLPGTYFVEITDNMGRKTIKKLIKE